MKKSCKLGNCLAGIGGMTALATSHSQGAIVQINLGDLGLTTGINAGISTGAKVTIADWLGAGTGTLKVYNQYQNYYSNARLIGLNGGWHWSNAFLDFAVSGSGFASPFNFSAGAPIDASSTFTGSANHTTFYRKTLDTLYESPAFSAGSYMGFRMGNSGSDVPYKYGWLEVTWDPNTDQFNILSGAYESEANTAIAAGDTGVTAVPEPSGALGLACLIAGSAFLRRRKAA